MHGGADDRAKRLFTRADHRDFSASWHWEKCGLRRCRRRKEAALRVPRKLASVRRRGLATAGSLTDRVVRSMNGVRTRLRTRLGASVNSNGRKESPFDLSILVNKRSADQLLTSQTLATLQELAGTIKVEIVAPALEQGTRDRLSQHGVHISQVPEDLVSFSQLIQFAHGRLLGLGRIEVLPALRN